MIIYKDIIHDEELLSESLISETTDLFFVVKGSMIIPPGDEEDPDAEKVLDIVFHSKLEPIKFTKKTYVSNLKKLVKAIVKNLKKTKTEEEVAEWQTKVNTWMSDFLEHFDDYDFYLGPSQDLESGFVVLAKWDGADPYFYFWKDGLKSEKV